MIGFQFQLLRVYLLFILAPSLFSNLFAQHISLVHYDSVHMTSKDQNLSTNLYVHLPTNYNENLKVEYPVIYVLDPEYRFAQTLIALQTLSAEQNAIIPEAILVGVPSRDRYRDFTPASIQSWHVPEFIKETGGSEKFIPYLLDEVIPFIDKNYRTVENRMLIGHSLGGLLALEIFATKSHSFFSYLLLDPSTFWNNGGIVSKVEKLIPKINSEVRVFLADGLVPEGMEVRLEPSQQKFETLMNSAKNPKLIYNYKGLRGESHNEMSYLGIYIGLKTLFSDYQPEMPWKFSPQQIVEYYKELSARYGYEVSIPKKIIERGNRRN